MEKEGSHEAMEEGLQTEDPKQWVAGPRATMVLQPDRTSPDLLPKEASGSEELDAVQADRPPPARRTSRGPQTVDLRPPSAQTSTQHNNQTHTRSETQDASGGLADRLLGANGMRKRGLAKPGRETVKRFRSSGTLDEPG